MPSAFYIGRFQPLHKGHLSVINYIESRGYTPMIVIGDSGVKSPTDPFTVSERELMIRAAVSEDLKIFSLRDAESDVEWVSNLLKLSQGTRVAFGNNPDTYKCFENTDVEMQGVPVTVDINSTKIRKMMAKNEDWQQFVPQKVVRIIEEIAGADRVKGLNV